LTLRQIFSSITNEQFVLSPQNLQKILSSFWWLQIFETKCSVHSGFGPHLNSFYKLYSNVYRSRRAPRYMLYLPNAVPTKPISEIYGRAQPSGQPVIRIVISSFSNLYFASTLSIFVINEGI